MTLDILESDYFNAADYFVDRHIREGRADKVEGSLGRINKIIKLAKEGLSLTRHDLTKIVLKA